MKNEQLNALYYKEDNAVDFPVRQVIYLILDHVKISDVAEMYLIDPESEKYFFVDEITDYKSLREIIQPAEVNGDLNMYDFDILLNNGVSIFTHEALSVQCDDLNALFKWIDFIFRHFKLDPVKCKEQLLSNPDTAIVF